MSEQPKRVTVWQMATALFERIYSSHPGTEPEAFAAAVEATEAFIPALREEMGFKPS